LAAELRKYDGRRILRAGASTICGDDDYHRRPPRDTYESGGEMRNALIPAFLKRKFKHRKLFVLTGLLVAGAGAGVAFAAFPDSNVATYTGCLNVSAPSGGQISQVAIGLSPLKQCGSNQQVIHLSGGDITKVTAGLGLTNGGDNGAVSLSLAPSYILPQGCNEGQVAVAPKFAGNAWQCADGVKGDKGDPGPPGPSDAYANYGDGVHTIGNGLTQTVASVTVPAGSYVLSATVAAGGLDGFPEQLQCSFTGGTVHGVVALVQSNGRSAVIGDTTVTGTANPIFLRCFMQDGTADASGELIAIHIGTVTQSE
jgi:hypothetical protein